MSTLQFHRIYTYALDQTITIPTCVFGQMCQVPPQSLLPTNEIPWVRLAPTGEITIKQGYSWDGASGLAIDTKDFMRASLVHDALYQLIKEGVLPLKYRKAADKTLVDLARQDGMGAFRRAYVYFAVRLFGRLFLGPIASS